MFICTAPDTRVRPAAAAALALPAAACRAYAAEKSGCASGLTAGSAHISRFNWLQRMPAPAESDMPSDRAPAHVPDRAWQTCQPPGHWQAATCLGARAQHQQQQLLKQFNPTAAVSRFQRLPTSSCTLGRRHIAARPGRGLLQLRRGRRRLGTGARRGWPVLKARCSQHKHLLTHTAYGPKKPDVCH